MLTSSARYQVEYYHPRVLAAIEAWPVDILADYARLVELLADHGPNLRLPPSRTLGSGLFELRPRGRTGIGRALYCFLAGRRVVIVHAFVKKTEQTADTELALARKRARKVRNG